MLPDWLDWLSYLAGSSKSHREISISCIFLQFPHQVELLNVVKCWGKKCGIPPVYKHTMKPRQEPREHCHPVPKKHCRQIPQSVPKEECIQVPKEKCREYPIKTPKKIPRKECQTIPRKHCEKVPKKVPRKIYRRIPRYFCEKKKGTFEFMDDLFG